MENGSFNVFLPRILPRHCRSNQRFYAGLTAILGIGAYLLRTAGVALLVSWTLESVFRRRYREAGIRNGGVWSADLLWQIHIWHVTTSDEYHRPAYSYQRAPGTIMPM